MIQLATEPTARQTSHRPAANDANGSDRESQRGRSSHAWPFLSRYVTRPLQQAGRKDGANDSGS